MWNLKKKMVQMNLFTKQIVTDVENKLMVGRGSGGKQGAGGGLNWETGIEIYTLLYIK